MKVSIVIPVYDGAQMTKLCLDTLLAMDLDAEVVVVDDASSDETAALLQAYGSSILTERNERNRGYAYTCNRGAALATGEFLLLLNNDTVPRRGFLDELLAAAEKYPEAAIFGSKLLYPDGTVQHAGVAFNIHESPYHIYEGLPADHPAVNRSRAMQAVTAACMLIRSDVYHLLGGFDEGFINSGEDVDLCLRAAEAGYTARYVPTSVVTHLESASRGRTGDYIQQSMDMFYQRWRGRVLVDDLAMLASDGLLRVRYQLGGRLHIGVDPDVGDVMVASPYEAEVFADEIVGRWLETRDFAARALVPRPLAPVELTYDAAGYPHRAENRHDWAPKAALSSREGAAALGHRLSRLDLRPRSTVPTRVNVLCDGLDESILFGRYATLLQVANLLAATGTRVRIVGVGSGGSPSTEIWQRASTLPGCAGLMEVEYADCSDRDNALSVSPADRFVATSCWTMHLAHASAEQLSAPRPLWIQQDFEPARYPDGAFRLSARAAYDLPHAALIATDFLRDALQDMRVGVFAGETPGDHLVFQPPLTTLDDVSVGRLDRPVPRRILVHLDDSPAGLAEVALGGLELVDADGTLPAEWKITTVGAEDGGTREWTLSSGRPVSAYGRLRPARYLALLGGHDVGLALHHGPRPSPVSLDMAASGLTTVTSVFPPAKSTERLQSLSTNLIAVQPTPEDVARAIGAAVTMAGALEARVDGAGFAWPRSVAQAFPPELADAVRGLVDSS